ncbi:MAG TPA: hypothetical protein GXZ87_08030 [Bacteroidales bacterium]|nr:hypothetical protein [Bacteroidales bacterium]
MKNLIKALAVVVLVTTFFASCNRRKNSVDSSKLNLKSAEAEFYGDETRENVDTYVLFLNDDKLTSDPDGDGRFIRLEMNVEPSNMNEIIPGTYVENISSRPIKLTFEKGKEAIDDQGTYIVGSYIGTYIGDQFLQKPIISGNLRVAQNGYTYTISGVVVAEGQTYNIEYKGEIEFYDFVEPLPKTLTHGEIWNQGDLDGDGLSIFSIRLGGKNVDISDFSGTDDAMQIEVYVPTDSGFVIPPNRDYPIGIDGAEAFTAMSGHYDDYYGTCYYTADKLNATQGKVTITQRPEKGSTYYTIDFDLLDDWYGYAIKGSYEGHLPLVDKSKGYDVKPRAVVRSTNSTSPVANTNAKIRGKVNKTMDKRQIRPTERRVDKNIPKAVRTKRK